jgi:Flp pilus assembly protein CpaB
MATQVRPPRTRGTGGRTLMLLGVLLALFAGIIVVYVVSTAVGPPTHTETVVVANKNLTSSTILSAGTSDSSHTLVSDAFVTKQMNSDVVPQDAYVFQSPSQLSIDLTDKVVVGQFFAGDVLRKADPRLVPVGLAGNSLSLAFRNPNELPAGSVIYPLTVDSSLGLVPGDHVDVLITVAPAALGIQNSGVTGDASQTTLQNVYVYAVDKGVVDVVLKHQEALVMKYLTEHAHVTLVLRKPGDSAADNTSAVTSATIIQQYFHP